MSGTTEKAPVTVVKKVKFGALLSDGSIRIERVIASHPNVGSPYKGKDDDGNEQSKYSVKLLLPKETHKEVFRLIRDNYREIMAENKVKDLADEKKFMRDGDRLKKPETEGMYQVSASNGNRPFLRGPKNDPKTGKPQRLTPAEAKEMIYGGCIVTAVIEPWWQDHKKYGQRVNANLRLIQFIEDGTPFGRGRITDDEADDYVEGEDADDTDYNDDDDAT